MNLISTKLFDSLLQCEMIFHEDEFTCKNGFVIPEHFCFTFWVGEEMHLSSVRKQLQKCDLGEWESLLKQGQRNWDKGHSPNSSFLCNMFHDDGSFHIQLPVPHFTPEQVDHNMGVLD